MKRFPMIPAAYVKLREELNHLKRVERHQISAAIESAREHGDLKENAEYHAAKDKQGISEARIRTLETMLALADVIDPTKLRGKRISFGATVELLDLDTDEELRYSIVGEQEADIRRGLLNYGSPLAAGLMGKEEGDEVAIPVEGGMRNIEVLSVSFVEIALGDD